MKQTLSLIAIIAVGAGAGCETESPHFDSQLGTSTAHMVQAQTLDPATAGNPAALAPTSADGQRIKNAIDQYRKDVIKPEQSVSRPIFFEVGQQGQ
jgi:type IV pilus biogenesis protein CpaD/CtpE